MTKAELVAKMAAASGVSKVAAEKALDSCLAGIRGSLRRGEAVTLVGFGTFMVGRRKSRKGRNPRTGQLITIAATKVPRFRPSRVLKTSVSLSARG
jgi:DNA-binding protein HU-beta